MAQWISRVDEVPGILGSSPPGVDEPTERPEQQQQHNPHNVPRELPGEHFDADDDGQHADLCDDGDDCHRVHRALRGAVLRHDRQQEEIQHAVPDDDHRQRCEGPTEEGEDDEGNEHEGGEQVVYDDFSKN